MFDSYDQIFARRADRYGDAMAMCPEARAAEFAAVASPIGPDARNLFDMPAGGGWLRKYLRGDIHYVAVEPAVHFFDSCPDEPGAERINSAIETVPRKTGVADVVVSLTGLHHAPDLGAVFDEFRRLLRPGGLLVIADVARASAPARFLDGYVHANSPMGHVGRFLDAETAPLLRAAGFNIVADELVEVPWRFADPVEAGAYTRLRRA